MKPASQHPEPYLPPEPVDRFDVNSWAKTVDAVLDRTVRRSAFLWLCRWAGAGFPAKAQDGKILITNGHRWKEWFTDGPFLVDILRKEIGDILLHPESARLQDPSLRQQFWLSYTHPYLHGVADHLAKRINACVWAAERAERGTEKWPADHEAAVKIRAEIPAIEAELAVVRKRLSTKPPG